MVAFSRLRRVRDGPLIVEIGLRIILEYTPPDGILCLMLSAEKGDRCVQFTRLSTLSSSFVWLGEARISRIFAQDAKYPGFRLPEYRTAGRRDEAAEGVLLRDFSGLRLESDFDWSVFGTTALFHRGLSRVSAA
jgi:hypothetical protein